MSKPVNGKSFRFRKMIVLLILLGAALVIVSSVSAEKGVTISAYGDLSYYYGEEVILHGIIPFPTPPTSSSPAPTFPQEVRNSLHPRRRNCQWQS